MAIRQSAVEGVAVNPSFWRGRKVFLTGHTGFKGSWLSLWLQQLGAEVTGYALPPPTKPSLFDVARFAQGMTSLTGDIRDGAALAKAMREAAPDIVIHMAAQSLVHRSYVDPVETYSTNVMGTVHLLEAVRQAKSVRAVVSVTSDKCYENKEWVWGYRESEPMGGFDPYSNSKGCAELVTAAYRNSFFNPAKYSEHHVALASARAGNVIGGGDWAADRLIPDILRAISENRSVVIRNPHAIRPWQHVLEPLSGYLLLAQNLYEDGIAYAEGWNFGPNEEDAKPVQWIVERLTQQWGEGASWKLDQANHPHEALYLKLDCSKAKMRLDWKPRWTLAQTLENIIAWHKAHQRGDDMRELSLRQIAAFQEQVTI
jgi:CDP-glucose 4,6-dehydratase